MKYLIGLAWAPGEAGLLGKHRELLQPLVPRHIERVQLLSVHKLVDAAQRHRRLHHEHDELGQHVERHAQQVEVGEADEGGLGVQHVGGVDENVGGEGGDGYEEGGARPQEGGEGAQVGSLGGRENSGTWYSLTRSIVFEGL